MVVNWNGGEDNLACLGALVRQGDALAEIVFVDNASSDGSLELVRASYPGLVVLPQSANLGYGGGNNVGIARALEHGAQAVLIVNNDVILPSGTLARLARALDEHPTAGIVGPRVLYRDEPARLWAAGGSLTWRENLTTLRGHREADASRWQRTEVVDYVLGCALLVRAEVLRKLGGFDERYFAYTEDVDFGLRARAEGWQSLCVGEASALHAPSSATGGGYNPRRKYMMAVNSIWFLRRWAGPLQWCSFLLFDVLSLPLVWLVGLARGRGRAVCAKAMGLLDGLRGKRVRAEILSPGGRWPW